jgi:hypothetical protein
MASGRSLTKRAGVIEARQRMAAVDRAHSLFEIIRNPEAKLDIFMAESEPSKKTVAVEMR